MQGSLILRGCVVDELQSAKEVYHCTNNLEDKEERRKEWGRDKH